MNSLEEVISDSILLWTQAGIVREMKYASVAKTALIPDSVSRLTEALFAA